MTKANDFIAQEITNRTGKQWNEYFYSGGRGLVSIKAIALRNDDDLDTMEKFSIKSTVCDLLGWDTDDVRMRVHSQNKMLFIYKFNDMKTIQETPNGFRWTWSR